MKNGVLKVFKGDTGDCVKRAIEFVQVVLEEDSPVCLVDVLRPDQVECVLSPFDIAKFVSDRSVKPPNQLTLVSLLESQQGLYRGETEPSAEQR